MEEGIQRPREVSKLEWIYCERPKKSPHGYVPWEGAKDTLFTNYTQDSLVGGASATPRSLMMALLCRPGLMVGDAAREPGTGSRVLDQETTDTRWQRLTFSSQVDTIIIMSSKCRGE